MNAAINAENETKRHAEADAQAAAMYAGQLGWQARQRVADAKLRAAFATVRPFPDASDALRRLVYGGVTSHLATLDPVFADWGPQAGNTGLDALVQFALLFPFWLRLPEDWTPPPPAAPTDDKRAALSALAHFLFCHYPLPAPFDRAWLGGFDDFAGAFRQIFIHLGQGGRLEAVRFPCPMSHRAAHHFMHAPDDFSLPAALRWGQIKALNGSEALAHTLRETVLQNGQTDEAFWFSFVQFLINHPDIPLWQIGPLIDYVRFRKFGGGQSNDEEGGEGPEPDFSMKGRTSGALLQSMTEWHETLQRTNHKRADSWPASRTIMPLDLVLPDGCSVLSCRWRIREITQSMDLMAEGQAMRHCVRTYQNACEKGKTSVWSLQVILFDPNALPYAPKPVSRRLLTIEVNNQRRAIVQVRGKCNQTLPQMRAKNRRMMDARHVLRDWAGREHLGIACSL